MTSFLISSPRCGYDRYWYWRGWRIHYSYLRPRSLSSAPPLVFVHGFGAALGHWRNNLQALGEFHPVYALDLLGFGRSQKAGASYNPAFFAELLADFCDTFVQRPVILVGNSLGSVISLLTASRYAQRVQGLVLINLPDVSLVSRSSPATEAVKTQSPSGLNFLGGLVRYLFTFLFTSPLVINPLLAIVRSPQILYSALRNAYADPRRVDDELKALIREPTLDPLAPLTLRCLTRGMGQLAPEDQARSTLPQLQIPILLIWGKQDRLVPPSLARRCVDLNPRIHLVELDQAGHCPQDECSDRVNGVIVEWLQKTIPQSHNSR